MRNFELNIGCGVVNYQTHHRAMVDKPAKVTDGFDYGTLMDPNNQRDQWFQTGSSVTTPSWSQSPNPSWQHRWWEHAQNSRDRTDYHDARWQGSQVFSHGEEKPSVYRRSLEEHRRVVEAKATRQQSSRAGFSAT